jgi:TrkA-N domain
MTRSAEADMFIKSTPNVALPRPGLAVLEAADALPYRCLRGHVIVCGLHPLGLRIVEVLRSSAVPVVVVDDDPDPRLVSILGRWDIPHIAEAPRLPEVLINAGLDGARAVVSVEADDLQNLETALIVRSLRPNVRIIVQMSNAAVGAAVSHLVTSGAALDVAALAAPSLVQACLGGGQLDLDLAGQRFAVTETVVTRPGTLRSIYGDLVPIAVNRTPGPGRDLPRARPPGPYGRPSQCPGHGAGSDRNAWRPAGDDRFRGAATLTGFRRASTPSGPWPKGPAAGSEH